MTEYHSGNAGRILSAASAIIDRCERHHVTLDDALDSAPAEFRRTLNHLLLTFYRRKKILERDFAKLFRRPPAPEVWRLLLLCGCQCRYQRGISPQSAVNVAVDAAKKFRADKFVNAVMRNFLRLPQITEATPENVLPSPVLKRWKRRFSPAELAGLTGCFLSEAEFTFRILPGFEMVPGGEVREGFGGFRYAAAPADAVLDSPEFAAGGYYIQDAAPSLAVSLTAADAVRAAAVLDVCAAPGGKTLMLGELCQPGTMVVAADINPVRQKRTQENFTRYQRDYRVVTASPEELTGEFDIVLADVPCSNTGVFRKRPDALWRFSEAHLQEVCALQKKIISAAVKRVKKGGILIVSTCSIEPEENEALAAFAAGLLPGMVVEESRLLLPDAHRDGAFAARLRLAAD